MSETIDALDPLTQEVLTYQKTGQNYRELFQKIALRAYRFAKRRFAWNHDKACDFYLRHVDALDNMIRRFKYTGKPFENYLCSMLVWKTKNQLKNLEYRALQNPYLENPMSFDETLYVQETPPENPGDGDLQTRDNLYETLTANPGSRRRNVELRMLMLLLKCAWEVEDSQVEDFVQKTKFKAEVVQDYISQIRDKTLPQKLRRDDLVNKRRHTWDLEQKYTRLLDLYPDRADRWTRLQHFYQRRGLRIQEALSKLSLSPTHQQIADVLEVRKGTVDSSLFYFRNMMEKVSKDQEKSYTCPHGNSHRIRKSS